MRIASWVKGWVVPNGTRARTVAAGPLRGATLALNLKSQTQVWLGLQERELHPYLERLAAGARCLVDVGAADGAYTLYFLLKTEAKRIIAYEPLLRTGESDLMTNLRLNHLQSDPRLTLLPLFAGSRNDESSRALDSVVTEADSPCLVKVDTEGAEGDVLNGAERLMAGPDTRWIIETHGPELEAECLARLVKANYAVKVVDKAWWRALLPELRPRPHNRWIVAARNVGLLR